MDRTAICAFMNRHRYAVVSSTGASGSPQSALVAIAASSALKIIFDTVKSSRKYSNLIQRPHCSLVIGWSGEQTLQLEGIAEELKVSTLEQLHEVYFAQWPDGRQRMNWPEIAYFVVHPNWIRYSDYDQSPPFIQELAGQALANDF